VINNAVEHSRGREIEIGAQFAVGGTTVVTVCDDGVGVFRRICEDFVPLGSLCDRKAREGQAHQRPFPPQRRTALLLVEGRFALSTGESEDPMDRRQRCRRQRHRAECRAPRNFGASRGGAWLVEVFGAYTDPERLRFSRTRATVKLVAYGKALVSRSEARRLVEGLTKFSRVTVFSGVEVVGQGFCDKRGFPGVRPQPSRSRRGNPSE
jgi:hypothetical protein